MRIPVIRKIVILGAGNLATNLALGLKKEGYKILQVCNRTEDHGRELAKKVKADYTRDLSKLNLRADLYIISVTDRAIEEIAQQVNVRNKIVVHTSGSVDMDVLRNCSVNYGVLHSPQTFLKSKPVSFKKLHIDIEASNRACEMALVDFAAHFCRNVHVVTSGQRKIIHVAAVFAGNFSNFMYAVANDILSSNHLPFDLMQPIIKKTAKNATYGDPFSRQTGPALREDNEVIDKHIEALSAYPQYRELYDLVTKSIIKYKKLHE
jgi:predicted short-subunit dehydrogenase-like oxidoreductase (DUF2520 family)